MSEIIGSMDVSDIAKLYDKITALTKLGNDIARDLDENTIGLDSLKEWQAFTDSPERPQEGHRET